jgi:hypothetical protein
VSASFCATAKRRPVSLKPCPFCGEEARIELWHGGGPRKHLVSCDNEFCFVTPSVTGGSAAVAIRRWNQRLGGTAARRRMTQAEKFVAVRDALLRRGAAK